MAELIAPKTLADVWSLPIGAFNQGMRGYEQAQQMDNQTLADLISKSQFEAQSRPLKLQELVGMNRNRDAEYQGILARTENQQRQNLFDEKTFQPKLDEFFRANKAKIKAEHLTEMQNAGQGMQMLAESVWSNPTPGYAQRARQQLEKIGAADFWNPDWERLPPDRLAMELSNVGKGIVGTIPKFQQALAVQESKNTTAERNADVRATTAMEIAKYRADVGRQMAEIRAKGTKASIPKLEQLLTEAYQKGDMETAVQLSELMRYVKARDDNKPQVDTTQIPIFKPPEKLVNPLTKPKGTKPKTGDKLPDGSIYIE